MSTQTQHDDYTIYSKYLLGSMSYEADVPTPLKDKKTRSAQYAPDTAHTLGSQACNNDTHLRIPTAPFNCAHVNNLDGEQDKVEPALDFLLRIDVEDLSIQERSDLVLTICAQLKITGSIPNVLSKALAMWAAEELDDGQ